MNGKFYDCFKGETKQQDLEKAKKQETDIMSVIMMKMTTDDENDSQKLISAYLQADEEEKAIMDYVLVCICGWTMSSIISKIN